MGTFKEIGLTWNGQEYVVKPDQVMGLIFAIEEHITLEDMVGGGVKRARLSLAFSAALNYAGCKASPQDVYNSLFSDKGLTTAQTVAAILAIVVPPDSVKNIAQKPSAEAGKPQKKAAAGSKKPTQ